MCNSSAVLGLSHATTNHSHPTDTAKSCHYAQQPIAKCTPQSLEAAPVTFAIDMQIKRRSDNGTWQIQQPLSRSHQQLTTTESIYRIYRTHYHEHPHKKITLGSSCTLQLNTDLKVRALAIGSLLKITVEILLNTSSTSVTLHKCPLDCSVTCTTYSLNTLGLQTK